MKHSIESPHVIVFVGIGITMLHPYSLAVRSSVHGMVD